MPLRHTLTAATGALTLALSMTNPAHAAEGDFHYAYTDEFGSTTHHATMHSPKNDTCINLYPFRGEQGEQPGYEPDNQTDYPVTVYFDMNCKGTSTVLVPRSGPNEDARLRSARFGDPQQTPPADTPAPTTPAGHNSDLEAIAIELEPTFRANVSTLHAQVVNNGPETTTAPMTITVHLPEDTRAQEEKDQQFFPSDTCSTDRTERTATCTFPAGVKSGRPATAHIPIRIDDTAPAGTLNAYWTVTDPADDPNPTNNRADFTITITE
ncbi:hypothetical protein [Streptomyces sp. NPDC059918]|uniref:hypothetical protein n=1 Tax=unclassified Streptomyces TaxID=2593676 RepID=UPI00365F85DA